MFLDQDLPVNITLHSPLLILLNLQNLSDRHQMLVRRFSEKCLKSDRFKDPFPLNDNNIDVRNDEIFFVIFAHTDNLRDSSIPAMQRLLNKKVK
jgi:hypothetical protein